MISLIICSRTPELSDRLAKNIAETIGAVYEIVLVDNSANQLNIFEAYNKGVEQSKYPHLCFMHDDITYHTNNWGKLLIDYLQDEKIGAIGMAGSPYVTKMPGSWWAGNLVFQRVINHLGNKIFLSPQTGANKANKFEVAVLDGVWFAIKKKRFETVKFDTENYRGFHLYDLDISMQLVQAGCKNFFVDDMLIEHHSAGDVNKTWCENVLIFNNKWKASLPFSVSELSFSQRMEAELTTLREYVNWLLYNKYPVKFIYKLIATRALAFGRLWAYPKSIVYLAKCFASINKYGRSN